VKNEALTLSNIPSKNAFTEYRGSDVKVGLSATSGRVYTLPPAQGSSEHSSFGGFPTRENSRRATSTQNLIVNIHLALESIYPRARTPFATRDESTSASLISRFECQHGFNTGN
jgi:hypothetical protein